MAWILSCCGCGTGPAAVAPIGPLAWELPYAAAKKKTKQWRFSSISTLQLRKSKKFVDFCKLWKSLQFPSITCAFTNKSAKSAHHVALLRQKDKVMLSPGLGPMAQNRLSTTAAYPRVLCY